jgi:hypothetical protein
VDKRNDDIGIPSLLGGSDILGDPVGIHWHDASDGLHSESVSELASTTKTEIYY